MEVEKWWLIKVASSQDDGSVGIIESMLGDVRVVISVARTSMTRDLIPFGQASTLFYSFLLIHSSFCMSS